MHPRISYLKSHPMKFVIFLSSSGMCWVEVQDRSIPPLLSFFPTWPWPPGRFLGLCCRRLCQIVACRRRGKNSFYLPTELAFHPLRVSPRNLRRPRTLQPFFSFHHKVDLHLLVFFHPRSALLGFPRDCRFRRQ